MHVIICICVSSSAMRFTCISPIIFCPIGWRLIERGADFARGLEARPYCAWTAGKATAQAIQTVPEGYLTTDIEMSRSIQDAVDFEDKFL